MARRIPEGPSWKIRRRIIVATLLFCAGEIVYLTIWGKDISLHETIANGAWLLGGATVGSYVFGAIWDSKNVMNFAARTGEEDDDPPLRPWRRRGPPGYAPADDDPPPPRGS